MSDNISQEKSKSKKKKWWTKPITWIPTLILFLTIIGQFLDLPKKISESYEFITGNEFVTTPLRGIVINKIGNPVVGAIIKIVEIPGDSVKTTSEGGFYFAEVPGNPGDRIRLYVSSQGYKSHNEYVTLPGPVTIMLDE